MLKESNMDHFLTKNSQKKFNCIIYTTLPPQHKNICHKCLPLYKPNFLYLPIWWSLPWFGRKLEGLWNVPLTCCCAPSVSFSALPRLLKVITLPKEFSDEAQWVCLEVSNAYIYSQKLYNNNATWKGFFHLLWLRRSLWKVIFSTKVLIVAWCRWMFESLNSLIFCPKVLSGGMTFFL